MKKTIALIIISAWFILSIKGAKAEGVHDFSGEVSVESRNFYEDGLYGNTDNSHNSLGAKATYSYAWDNDRKVVVFTPFVRLADPDNRRTHADIRELAFVGAWDNWELRAGISKVFWGVTESFHLVDVINQVDLVENIDLEDRLGQPMINPTYVSDYGNFSFFILPYFRERTFPGENGRLRFSAVVDTQQDALYEDSDEESHIDYAFRWSHYWGDLEWGLSYFKGTSREPIYRQAGNVFLPLYYQMERVSIDAQYLWGDFLFKTELLYQDANFDQDYFATVTGFEYTFSNVFGGKDIGLLMEYAFDERKEQDRKSVV